MSSDNAGQVRVKELFNEAIERPPTERAAFLDAACGDDTEVRKRVDRLLLMLDEEPDFLKSPPPTADHGAQDNAATDGTGALTGTRIGHYELTRVIAAGGMGTVYEAIQENPHRTVAVKVMRRGIASKSALRRFEYESQILARLRHPAIAQVHEAGTYDDGGGGVPYFVMEYVPDARPITDYVKHRKLGTRDRLELFTTVCEAVHHGHQRGIIHRDLKPANILIDALGQPKIIDFGVARATDSDVALTTLQTDMGELIGTLQYMSPEQCRADPDDLDTRSDVYALGVVLYELLCEQLPYDVTHAPVPEAVRVIREENPTRPSTINKTLRGDVETILLKALAKERDRRYQSASDLAGDITRYLRHEPIEARPPSAIYQFRKFARRHRGLVAGVLAVLAVTVLGSSAATVLIWQEQARTQKALDRADANLSKALEAVNQMLTRVGAVSLVDVPQMEEVRRDLFEDALMFYLGFLEDSGGDPTIRLEVARAQRPTGEIYALLGEHEKALEHYESSIDTFDDLLVEFPTAPALLFDLSHSLERLGGLLGDYLQIGESEAAYRRSLDIRQSLVQRFPDAPQYRRALARSHDNLGTLMRQAEQFDEAEKASVLAIGLYEALVSAAPDELGLRSDLAAALANLGELHTSMASWEQAADAYRRSLDEQEVIADSFASSPDFRHSLARNYASLGSALFRNDQDSEAEQALREALALCSELTGDFPKIPAYGSELARVHVSLGELYEHTSRLPHAEAAYHAAIAIAERLAGDFPDNPNLRYEQGATQKRLGAMLLMSGEDLQGSGEATLSAAESFEGLVADYPIVRAFRMHLGQTCKNLGLINHLGMEYQAAEQWYRRAIQVMDELGRMTSLDQLEQAPATATRLTRRGGNWTADYTNASPGRSQAEVYSYLGTLLGTMGRYTDGEQAFNRGEEARGKPSFWHARYTAAFYHDLDNPDPVRMVETARGAAGEVPEECQVWHALGMALYRTGDWHGALDAFRRSREIRSGGACPFDCFFFVAMTWWQLGDREQAHHWYEAGVQRLEEGINPNLNLFYADFFRYRIEAEELMGVTTGALKPES